MVDIISITDARAIGNHAYPSGWRTDIIIPAYYYQQQAPQVTTVVIQSQPVTTTTTTTTIEEEYVYEKPRYVAKKRYKPPKRVWKPKRETSATAKRLSAGELLLRSVVIADAKVR